MKKSIALFCAVASLGLTSRTWADMSSHPSGAKVVPFRVMGRAVSAPYASLSSGMDRSWAAREKRREAVQIKAARLLKAAEAPKAGASTETRITEFLDNESTFMPVGTVRRLEQARNKLGAIKKIVAEVRAWEK